MTTGNRPTRASCALSAIAASLLVLAVSCGGSGPHAPKPQSASQLVGQALGGRAAVRSGQVELSLSLLAPSAREAFVLHSATRFRLGAPGATPELTMTLATRSHSGSGPSRALRVALASGPHGFSLSVQGRPVHAGPQARRALQAGYARLTGVPAAGGGAVTPLGLDAAAWLTAPRFVPGASGRSAGAPGGSAEAAHVRAGLALAPFLADVARLAGVSAGLEQASGRVGATSTALGLSKAALTESGAGTVDLYADPHSRLPRRLVASLNLHSGSGAGGHSSPPVSVSLRMSFTALGEPAQAGPT